MKQLTENSREKILWKSMTVNCLFTKIIEKKSSFAFKRRNKLIQVWNNHFWVNYPFKVVQLFRTN